MSIKIKYIFLLATLVSCSWNVDDYEDVYKEIENKVSDLDSYWLKKKENKRTQQIGHGWGKKHLSDEVIGIVNQGLINSPTIEAIYHKIALFQSQSDLVDSNRLPRLDLSRNRFTDSWRN